MSELAEFLMKRIDEDYEEIGVALPGQPIDTAGPNGVGWTAVGTADELLMISKARAIADCTSKRAVVLLHTPIPGQDADPSCKTGSIPCFTLRAVALAYAGHPDYDPAWRP